MILLNPPILCYLTLSLPAPPPFFLTLFRWVNKYGSPSPKRPFPESPIGLNALSFPRPIPQGSNVSHPKRHARAFSSFRAEPTDCTPGSTPLPTVAFLLAPSFQTVADRPPRMTRPLRHCLNEVRVPLALQLPSLFYQKVFPLLQIYTPKHRLQRLLGGVFFVCGGVFVCCLGLVFFLFFFWGLCVGLFLWVGWAGGSFFCFFLFSGCVFFLNLVFSLNSEFARSFSPLGKVPAFHSLQRILCQRPRAHCTFLVRQTPPQNFRLHFL